MLRKFRLFLAGLVFSGICLLFLDSSGILSQHFAFLAKTQFLPAILASGIIAASALLISAFVFGRIYCSVICPLGVFQDIAGYFGKKRRFRYTPGKFWLRTVIFAAFIAAFFAGFPVVWNALEPYSAFGRIAAGLFAPVWALGNNALAYLSEKTGIFWISTSQIWIRGLYAFGFALFTFAVVGYLAWRSGRTWCNTICPVGTALGAISRFSLFRMRINSENCTRCGLCEKSCKSSCIDSKNGTIDATRCVVCLNCTEVCRYDAIAYSCPGAAPMANKAGREPDSARRGFLLAARGFLGVLGFLMIPILARASDMTEKPIPALTRKERRIKDRPVIPPGASGLRSYSSKCTGCQLCVSNCPNQALISSDRSVGALQPSLSFERGYCRVNCVKCSTVCPTGAIRPITVAEKSAIQIGRAVIDRTRCIRNSEDVDCSACARNCPAGVINLIQKNGGGKDIAVDEERCAGCGACEYFCPVRPAAAIVVIGNVEHQSI
jgi:ferredoxin